MARQRLTTTNRTMRIIPWPEPDSNKVGYTLVMEWWRGKRCVEDRRYQMYAEEFEGLKTSVLQAAEYKR